MSALTEQNWLDYGFNANEYLGMYADVAALWATGTPDAKRALDHFMRFGLYENRNMNLAMKAWVAANNHQAYVVNHVDLGDSPRAVIYLHFLNPEKVHVSNIVGLSNVLITGPATPHQC